MSGIRSPDCSKLAKNPKNVNGVTISRHDVIVKIFWRVLFLLSFFSYWSKFYVNIVIGSGIITIFFYKGLTRIPEIGITPFWGLPNISRLGRVMDTKFGTNVSKFQGYSFYRFGIIKEKQPVILPPPPTPRLGLKSKLVCNDLHMRISILLFQ